MNISLSSTSDNNLAKEVLVASKNNSNDHDDNDHKDQDHFEDQMNRFYTLAEGYLQRRSVEVKASHKCPHCWFTIPSKKMRKDNTKTQYCICDKLVAKLSKYNTMECFFAEANYHREFQDAPLLQLTSNIRIIIYMHYSEWMNAGNSGKLLLKCLNSNMDPTSEEGQNIDEDNNIVQLVLYGRRDDDNRLRRFIQRAKPNRVALLFPSSDAIDLGEFINNGISGTIGTIGHENESQHANKESLVPNETNLVNTVCAKDGNTSLLALDTSAAKEKSETPITLVVVDATYKKAKNMVKHFQKRINNIVANNDSSNHNATRRRIPTVKLNLDAISNNTQINKNDNESKNEDSPAPISSIFARAQKKYGKTMSSKSCDTLSHSSTLQEKATNHGRVCTVEAVAYALRICGESQNTVDALLDAVRVNNDAAKFYL